MPDDNDSIDFEHRLSRAEEAALEDVKEINALKKEIANLGKTYATFCKFSVSRLAVRLFGLNIISSRSRRKVTTKL